MSAKKAKHLAAINQKCTDCDISLSPHWLLVSLRTQRLHHYRGEECIATYAISTSARPHSCVEHSLGTPTGLHRVARKIGADAPLGMVFKGRLPTGQRYWELPPEERTNNVITTRILWLEGLESGHNRGDGHDTFGRYIYLHGTNHEDRIGSRQSHGCILLRNDDIIDLYTQVPEQSLVLIVES